jgi:hypothetical protein
MKSLVLILMCSLFLGCFTDAGERNAFELKARIGQIAMHSFIDRNENELKYRDQQFVLYESWSETLEKNHILYKSEIGMKTPSQTMYDGYGDCTNLALLSIWRYGYNNITGWTMMESERDSMHIVIIYKGNRVVSSRRSFIVDDLEEFHYEFNDYIFFNFYDATLDEEISSRYIYEEGILERK